MGDEGARPAGNGEAARMPLTTVSEGDEAKEEPKKPTFQHLARRSAAPAPILKLKNAVQVVKHANKMDDQEVRVHQLLETHEHHEKPDKHVFHPDHVGIKAWHVFTSMCVIYVCFIVPYDLGYSWWRIDSSHKKCQIAMDVYFWIDMAVSFNTGFYHDGHLHMKRTDISHHYLEFWFWIDLVANIPFEAILPMVFQEKSSRKAFKIVKWLKLPRLLRIGQLRKILKANARYLNLVLSLGSLLLAIHICSCILVLILDPCGAYPPLLQDGTEPEWTYKSDVDELMVISSPELGWECLQDGVLPTYYMMLHVTSGVILGLNSLMSAGNLDAGYYAQGGYSGGMSSATEKVMDLLDQAWDKDLFPTPFDLEQEKLSVIARYPYLSNSTLSALHSPSVTNPFGHTFWSPVFCWMILCQVIGLGLSGLFLAFLVKIISNHDPAETHFRRQVDAVNLEMLTRGVPHDMQHRVKMYFDNKFQRADYGRLEMLNPDLMTRSLRTKLAVSIYKAIILEVSFFKKCQKYGSFDQENAIETICLSLEQEAFLGGDAIYCVDDICDGLYLVEDGAVFVTKNKWSPHGDNKPDAESQLFKAPGKSSREEGVVGSVFGELDTLRAISNPETTCYRSESAIASEITRLLFLAEKVVEDLCEDDKRFGDTLKTYAKEELHSHFIRTRTNCRDGPLTTGPHHVPHAVPASVAVASIGAVPEDLEPSRPTNPVRPTGMGSSLSNKRMSAFGGAGGWGRQNTIRGGGRGGGGGDMEPVLKILSQTQAKMGALVDQVTLLTTQNEKLTRKVDHLSAQLGKGRGGGADEVTRTADKDDIGSDEGGPDKSGQDDWEQQETT